MSFPRWKASPPSSRTVNHPKGLLHNLQQPKALTKSTLCQTLKKRARQGSKPAAKGAYTDVSNRRLQARLTRQARIPSAFLVSEGIFAFAGFVSGLRLLHDLQPPLLTA